MNKIMNKIKNRAIYQKLCKKVKNYIRNRRSGYIILDGQYTLDVTETGAIIYDIYDACYSWGFNITIGYNGHKFTPYRDIAKKFAQVADIIDEQYDIIDEQHLRPILREKV